MIGAVWVFAGAGFGALGRYGLDVAIQSRWAHAPLPWATLIANTVGSAIIGIVAALSGTMQFASGATLLIGVGFCGGLTTVSSLNAQLLALAQERRAWLGLAYALVTIALALGATAGCYEAMSSLMS